MNSWSKVSVMFAVVVLAAAALSGLMGMLSDDNVAPALISSTIEEPAAEGPPPVREQPTILQAQPAIRDTQTRTLNGPNYQEWTPRGQSYSGEDLVDPSRETQSDNPRLLDRQSPPLRESWPQPGEIPSRQADRDGTPENAAPPASNEPISPQDKTRSVHLTCADDSLWSISKQRYGRGTFYVALYLHNRAKVPDPSRLEPGVAIETPPEDELRRLYPTHCPSP